MESKELTIVIVTFRSDEKITECLKSISNEIPVIVVENSNNENFRKKVEQVFSMLAAFLQEKIKDIHLRTTLD